MSNQVSQGIKHMRNLTEEGVPFSFSFVSLNRSNQTSKGLVIVDKALLRKSLKGSELIAYKDLTTKQDKFFHLPLLMSLNGKLIKHEY